MHPNQNLPRIIHNLKHFTFLQQTPFQPVPAVLLRWCKPCFHFEHLKRKNMEIGNIVCCQIRWVAHETSEHSIKPEERNHSIFKPFLMHRNVFVLMSFSVAMCTKHEQAIDMDLNIDQLPKTFQSG